MTNYITPPTLDGDTKYPPHAEQLLERRIVANLIHQLEQVGFQAYRVFDGEEYEKVSNMKEAMEVIFSVDESRLHVRQPGLKGHTIVIILGNGVDCISDHSIANEDGSEFNAVMDSFDAEKYTSI